MKNWLSPAFILAVALIAGGEFVARQFFSRSLSGRFEYGYNPTAGFQENADGTVNLVKSGGRPFRPQKFSRVPGTNTFRVMVFGHSVPYGYYGYGDAPLSDVYSSLIAEQLQQEGYNAEGINLCINGYGAKRVQIVLRQALKYHPSLVVLHVHQWSNDDLNDKRRKEFEGWHPKNWPMKLLIVRRLYEAKTERVFGKWLPKAITEQSTGKAELGQVMSTMAKPSPEVWTRWMDETIAITRENIAMARAQGVPVVLISQVTKNKEGDGKFALDDEGLDERVKSLAGPGVYFISMKDLMEKQVSWTNLFTDPVHLNRAGHEVISSAVVQLAHGQNLLPQRSERARVSSNAR